jgi:hypothetical protein
LIREPGPYPRSVRDAGGVDVDVSYAAPQVHGIVNVALHREYYLGIVFIFFSREEVSL